MPTQTSHRRLARRFGSAAIGLTAGLAAGSLGIGGGLVMVPALVLLLATPVKRAVGTSLLGVVAIAALAVVAELVAFPENLRWAAAASLSVGAVAGSVLGARVLARTPSPVLTRLLAAVLIVAALRMSGAVDGLLLGPVDAPGTAEPAFGWSGAAAHAAAGLGAGVVSSLFGVGGGILAVPLLAALHPGWPFQACRATSLVMIVPTALTGAILHRRLDHVDGRLAAGLLPGAAAGCLAGVSLANSVPGRPLELAFAALLAVTAWRLLRRAHAGRATRAEVGQEPG